MGNAGGRFAVVALGVLPLALACGGGGESLSLSASEKEALAGMERALGALGDAAPGHRLALLGEALSETVASGDQCFAALQTEPSQRAAKLSEHCGFGCSEAALEKMGNAPPAERYTVLLEACGAGHFGLIPETAYAASLETFMAHRMGKAIERVYRKADEATRARLDRALAAVEIPLPIPGATESYSLATASRLEATPPTVNAFVVVGRDGSLKVGRAPSMRVRAGGLSIEPGGLPGEPVAVDGLAKKLRELTGAPKPSARRAQASERFPPVRTGGHRHVKPAGDEPVMTREQAIEAARKTAILGPLEGPSYASLVPAWSPGRVPGLRLEGAEPHQRVIVVADRDAPATAVARVLRAAPSAVLAARHERRFEALVVPVQFGGLESGRARSEERPMELIVAIEGSAHSVLLATQGLVATLPRSPGGDISDALEASIARAREAPAMAERADAVVRVHGKATSGELHAVIDVLLRAGVKHVGLEEGKAADDTGLPPLGGARGSGSEANGPRVRIVELTSTGSLDAELLRKYVARRLRPIGACYEARRAVDPTLQGIVEVAFTITGDGRVANAMAAGMTPEIESCISRVITTIYFAKPKGGRKVAVRCALELQPPSQPPP